MPASCFVASLLAMTTRLGPTGLRVLAPAKDRGSVFARRRVASLPQAAGCCAIRRYRRSRRTPMKTPWLAFGLLLAAGAPAFAQQDVADFYKGKTVRIIVGVGVGSGYDLNARALARHLTTHIPGNPAVIVQNQPGAGSVTMTNQLYAGGPFDGTAIGASFNGLPTTPLLAPSASVRFEATRLNWIGSTNRESQAMYVWHTAPQRTLDDLYKEEMIVGAQAPG